MKRKILIILSALFLLVPWLAFYHEYLLFGEVYVAPTAHALVPGAEGTAEIQQLYRRDDSLVLYPEWTLLHFYQETGASPYWNPYQFSGMPLIPQSSFMDPLRFLLGLWAPLASAERSYMLAMMLRSAFALTFAFLIFRHFKIGYLFSAAGAIAFWFNSPLLVLHHATFDPVYLWVLIIWINLKLWAAPDRRRRLLWGLGMALAFAAEIFTWHLYFSMLFAILLVIFNGIYAIREYRNGRDYSRVLGPLSIFAGAGILAAVIGFFRIWTFVDLVGYSFRMVLPKRASGLVPYIPFGVLYFPYLYPFRNALELFTSIQLHPIHPDLKGVIGSFEDMRITFFPLFSRYGLIEAPYRSPLWYLILTFVFLESKTRRQAFPFWATFLLIFVGYNGLAALNVLNPVLGSTLPTILKAGNWLYLVITAAHSCLALCFGFGVVGLRRTLHLCQAQAVKRQSIIREFFSLRSRRELILIAVVISGMALLGTIAVEWKWKISDTPAKIVLVYLFTVLVPVMVLSTWIFRFKRPPQDGSQTRFTLSKMLSIATVLLLGYGATYILLGMQLRHNAPYVAEELRLGLVASGLDGEISQNTSSYFQRSLEQLYDPLPGVCWLLLAITACGLVLLWYGAHYPRHRTVVLLTLVLLLGMEGVVVTLNGEDHSSSQNLAPKAEWIDFLRDRMGHFRYLAYGREWKPALKTVSQTNGEVQQVYDLSLAALAVKKYGILKPSVDLLYRLEYLEGSSGLAPNDYRVFTYAPTSTSLKDGLSWSEIMYGTTEMEFPFYKSRAFDLLSMKYLVTQEYLNDPDYLLVYDKEIRIYENRRAFPRAWLVPSYEIYADRYEVLLRLSSPDFDPYQTAILEKQPVKAEGNRTRYGMIPQVPGNQGDKVIFTAMNALQRWMVTEIPEDTPLLDISPSNGGEVAIVSYSPGQIRYRVRTDSNQLLVLSEIFYPGWKARIDGRPTDIYRANYALMAIPVEAGEHKIELSFDPDSYTYARWISLGALLLAVVLVVIVFCRLQVERFRGM